MNLKPITTGLALVFALIVAGCGGGGGGGIGGTGSPVAVSYGGVTAKGSVWVNGVEFDTRGATIRIDDRSISGDDTEVKVGMVVQVDGSISAARADTVTVEGSIKGFVETVLDANRIVVMGQTVRTDDRTVYDNGIVPAQGDRVEVHGLVVSDGVVAAGYISKKPAAPAPTPPFAVKGYVRNVLPGSSTFEIGALTVNYANATLSDLGSGPANGQFVEVKGGACTGSVVCGTLSATTVKASGLRVSGDVQAEIEGFITSVAGSGFNVGNQPVTTTASTRFVGGVLGDLLAGAQVEVEGALRGGVLAATKVQFKDSIRLEADVATRNGAVLTLTGLPGVTVSVNSLTELNGYASVNDIGTGDHVRVRGRPGAGNAVLALRLEARGNSDAAVVLQASVAAVAAPTSLTLLGQTVTAAPTAVFQNLVGDDITRAAFFAALRPNTSLVKAKGTRDATGTVLTWREFELED